MRVWLWVVVLVVLTVAAQLLGSGLLRLTNSTPRGYPGVVRDAGGVWRHAGVYEVDLEGLRACDAGLPLAEVFGRAQVDGRTRKAVGA